MGRGGHSVADVEIFQLRHPRLRLLRLDSDRPAKNPRTALLWLRESKSHSHWWPQLRKKLFNQKSGVDSASSQVVNWSSNVALLCVFK